MRSAIFLLSLTACTTEPEPRPHQVHTEPAGGWQVRGPRVAVPPVQPEPLEQSGVIACADPLLRDESRYDTEWLDVPLPAVRDIASGGLIVADLDGDGWLDLVVAAEPLATFRGVDSGTAFAPDPLGLAGVNVESVVGGSAADFDGDGDLDLILTRWSRGDLLLRNDGGSFVDVTQAAGLSDGGAHSTTSSWDDFDGDGDLDLVIGRYGPTPDLAGDPALHGDPSSLYRNNGDGSFTDDSALLPVEVQSAYVFMSGWYDLDGDADRELFLVHDFGDRLQSRMFRNDGGDLVMDDSAGFHPDFEGMGLGVGDLNGDGAPDFLQTSVRTVSLLTSTPSADSETGVLYVESKNALGLQIVPGTASPKGHDWGWGAEIFDADNDGDQDAIATFGVWDTYFGNAKEHDELFEWDGQTFLEVAADPPWNLDWDAATRGIVVADLDGNGTLDMLRRGLDAPFRIDRGRCGDGAWLEISLQDTSSPNGLGVGSRIEVSAGDRHWTEWIGSGGSGMFSGGPPVAHLGLGDLDVVDEICAVWPDGQRQCFQDIDTRQILVLRR